MKRVFSGAKLAAAFTAALGILLASGSASAATLTVLVDQDNNPGTGCTVATPNGPLAGVGQRYVATVDTTQNPPRVTGVTRENCTAAPGTFSAPTPAASGSWPVGIGNGVGGADVIEAGLPVGVPGPVTIGVIYEDAAIGADAATTNPSGGPIVLASHVPGHAVPVPTLSDAMLAILLLLVLAVGWKYGRHRFPAAPMAIVALAMVSVVAWAAIVLDGLTNDWAGIPQAASDPADAEGADITAVFGTIEGTTVYVRVDARIAKPPVAVADSHAAVSGTPLVVAGATGLLANDARGVPAATVTSFGGGSVGGTVTTNAAGTAATFGTGGSLSVNADGSFSYTPATGFTGAFTFSYRIGNANGTSDALVTINTQQAPAITSANATTFNVGTPGTFTVTATGFPAPTLSMSGALPNGVTFDAATGVLSGTPGPGTAGTYPLTFRAANGVAPDATQSFTLTVTQGVAITSANAATFTVGQAGTFTVTTTASPVATTISFAGTLPSGVTFTNNGDGTATIAGTPDPATGGQYPISITASNGGASADGVQSFTLTVNQAPEITSVTAATFLAGSPGTHTVTTSGFPAPALVLSGDPLPPGVTFNPATGVLSGTPSPGTGGVYNLTFTATNGTLPNATQSFTLTVTEGALITSVNAVTFTAGAPGSFTVTTAGTPPVTSVTSTGALPTGVSFTDNGATGTLAGTPTLGTGGIYPLTITAVNGILPDATQPFTLTVNEAPVVTSANTATFTVGMAGSFTVTATGFPAPGLTVDGTLPSGVSFDPATGVLAGTPDPGTGGSYPLTVNASNGVGLGASQAFTLHVDDPAVATDDAYTVVHDDTLSVPVAAGLLANDAGTPAPDLLSVTGTGAACTAFPCAIATANGSATVQADGSFTYTPAADFAGTDAFTYGIQNSSGSDTATVTITVTNELPVVDLNGAAAGIDFAASFTEGAGPVAIVDGLEMTVTDADGTRLTGATVRITNLLDAGAETLAVTCFDPSPQCSGLIGVADVTYDPATGILEILADAWLVDYQALLRSLTYENSSPTPDVTPRVITVTVNDGIADNSPVAQATVTVAGVNNPPALAGIEGAALAYSVAGPPAAITSTLAVSDPDSTNLAGATVQITANCVAGDDVLAFTPQAGITGSYAAATCELTLTGNASLAAYQAALRSVTYANTNVATSTATRTVSFRVDDGEAVNNTSNAATRGITVAVNGAPVLAAGGTLNYTENDAPAAIDPAVTVTDADSPNLAGATVQVTGNCASAEDVLVFTNQSGITGAYNAGACLLTLAGEATRAQYETALRSVQYSNTSETPSTAARTVSWRVDDGGPVNNLSNTATSTVNVTASNDPPVLTAGATLAFTEGNAPTAIDGTITVTDPDTTSLAGATVTITGNCTPSQDFLGFVPQAGLFSTYTPATCQLVIFGTAPLATFQAVLRNVTYSNFADNPNTAPRTVTWIATDGTDSSTAVTSTITVTGVNDAPALSAIEAAALTFTENGAAAPISATLAVADPDSANLAGATVAITGNCLPGEDVLSFTDQNGITGAYDAATCTMTLGGAATVANYQAAIRSITYGNTSEDPNTAVRTLSIQADDGGGVNNLSNTVTRDITVIPVNDPPVATPFTDLPAQASIPISYPAGKLGGTDPEGTAVTIDTTPINVTNGTVTLNADGSFTFTADHFATTASFQYRVLDSGTPLPAEASAYATVSFDVSGPSIFFVKSPAVGTADCTLGNECLLAAAIAKIGTATNARIFLGSAGNHAGGITLTNGSWLIGQGMSTALTFAEFFGIDDPDEGTLAALPSFNLPRPAVASAAGAAITVGMNNALRGFDLTNSSGTGILGTNFGTLTLAQMSINTNGSALNLGQGTLDAALDSVTSTAGTTNVNFSFVAGTANLGSGALSGATGNAFQVSNGTGSITYGGTIASGGGRSVSVSNKSGGTVTLNGSITETGTGISLTSNTGATIAFNGGLNVNVAGNAFTATGGGTVTVTGSNNVITNTNGTALNVTNTTIGAAGLTFRSISSSGGAANGITLVNTGTQGGLTVTGDGTDTTQGGNSSGGTIGNKTGANGILTQGIGVYLSSTGPVVLNRMRIHDNQNYGIRGYGVEAFTLEYSTVNGTHGNLASSAFPETGGEGSIYFGNDNTNGIASQGRFAGNVISGGRSRNLSVVNTAGGATLTIRGNSFGLNQNFVDANQNLLVESRGGSLNVVLGGAVAGEGNTFAGAPGENVAFVGQASSGMTVTMQGNDLNNAHPNNVIGGGGLLLATQGSMTFAVEGNSIDGADGSAITLFKALSGSQLSGRVANNTIGTSGVPFSGSKGGNGIFVVGAGGGTMTFDITGNQIRQYAGNAAIYADNTGGSYTANFTIRNNLAAEPGVLAFTGLALTNGAPGSPDTINVCADIRNNDFSAAAPGILSDIMVVASGAATGHTFNLPGLPQPPTLAGVQDFIRNNNTLPGVTSVEAWTDIGVPVTAFTGAGTSCPLP